MLFKVKNRRSKSSAWKPTQVVMMNIKSIRKVPMKILVKMKIHVNLGKKLCDKERQFIERGKRGKVFCLTILKDRIQFTQCKWGLMLAPMTRMKWRMNHSSGKLLSLQTHSFHSAGASSILVVALPLVIFMRTFLHLGFQNKLNHSGISTWSMKVFS